MQITPEIAAQIAAAVISLVTAIEKLIGLITLIFAPSLTP